MGALVATFIEESAQGRVPDKESAEAKAYRAWSRAETVSRIVRESCIKVYGHQYYLLGSMV
jgi:hypothetical protein